MTGQPSPPDDPDYSSDSSEPPTKLTASCPAEPSQPERMAREHTAASALDKRRPSTSLFMTHYHGHNARASK